MSNFCEKIIKIRRKSKTFQSCKRIFLCLGGFIGAALSEWRSGEDWGITGKPPSVSAADRKYWLRADVHLPAVNVVMVTNVAGNLDR